MAVSLNFYLCYFPQALKQCVPVKMGQTLCMCSRGSITIDNKTYYFVQKLDEG